MKYQTFTDLMGVIKDFNNEITKKDATDAALSFYRYWGNYLDTTPAFLTFLMKPVGALAKGLYLVTNSLEHVFNNIFKMLGLFGYLENDTTIIGQFYQGFRTLGIAIFTFLLVARAVSSLLGKRLKYKDVMTHFMLVTLVVAVLPTAVTYISSEMAKDVQTIENVEGENSDTSINFTSLALQPIKNNVVDLKVLIDNDFDTSTFPMDSTGFINPPTADSTPVNKITDDTSKRDTQNFVTNIDFSANFGATDSDLLDKMDEKQDGMKGLFLHLPNSNQTGINSVTEHGFMKSMNSFEPVYLRYRVNWLGMFAQFATLIVLLVMMSVKVVKSIFETVLTAIIAPIQGYTSVESSKKFKELVMTIVGAFAGIFFETIIMRVTLEVMRDLPTLALSGVSGLDIGFFDGLNMWESCATSIIVYLGVFFGAMQGVTIIERWLGVSTGHSDTAQQLMGGMMMANALGSGFKGVASSALGAGGMAVNVAKNAPKTVGNVSSAAVKGIASTGGGIGGLVDSVKEQGLAGTAKAGISNAASRVGSGIQGVAQKAANSVGSSVDLGHNGVRGALKNNSQPQGTEGNNQQNPETSNSEKTNDSESNPRVNGQGNYGNQANEAEAFQSTNVDQGQESTNIPSVPQPDVELETTSQPGQPGLSQQYQDEGGSSIGNYPEEYIPQSNSQPVENVSGIRESSTGETTNPNQTMGGGIRTGKNSLNDRQQENQSGNKGANGLAYSNLYHSNNTVQKQKQQQQGLSNLSHDTHAAKQQMSHSSSQPTQHFQKANQDFQAMKSKMDMASQKMNGATHSHIKGVEIDDNE